MYCTLLRAGCSSSSISWAACVVGGKSRGEVCGRGEAGSSSSRRDCGSRASPGASAVCGGENGRRLSCGRWRWRRQSDAVVAVEGRGESERSGLACGTCYCHRFAA